MTRPYPLEWDSVLYPPKFKPPKLRTYDGKSSPNQYIYYFWSQTDNIIDNDAIMARVFIGTLKGVAFDWFRSLPNGSINSWVDFESSFFLYSMRMIPRWPRQTPLNSLERRRVHKGLHRKVSQPFSYVPCRLPSPMLLQTCRHTSSIRWKFVWELSKPILVKSLLNKLRHLRNRLKSLSPRRPRTNGRVNNRERETTQSSQPKGKETMVVGYPGILHLSRKGVTPVTTQSSSFCRNSTLSRMSKW